MYTIHIQGRELGPLFSTKRHACEVLNECFNRECSNCYQYNHGGTNVFAHFNGDRFEISLGPQRLG